MTEITHQTSQSNHNAHHAEKGQAVSSWLKEMISRFFVPLFKDQSSEDLRDQLEEAVGLNAEKSTSFSEQERMMIANILRYGVLRVEDVMVPRADIQAIDENASLQELLMEFQSGGHSRIPTYHETLDDPTGMVHVKDLLSWIADQHQQQSNQSQPQEQEAVGLKVITGGKHQSSEQEQTVIDFAQLAEQHTIADFRKKIKDTDLQREVLYVPPSMPVMNLLLRMQSTRVHMALVVDEYGGTDGLLSIEDLVEEVVGEIEDEHDENNGTLVSGTLETGLIASARTPIEELEEVLAMPLFNKEERDDDIDTLGGLVFALVGRVPVRGEVITHPNGLEIEVLTADPRRIKKIKITKKSVA